MRKEGLLRKDWDEFIKIRCKEVEKEVIRELKRALREKSPNIGSLFENVYKEMPPHLKE